MLSILVIFLSFVSIICHFVKTPPPVHSQRILHSNISVDIDGYSNFIVEFRKVQNLKVN